MFEEIKKSFIADPNLSDVEIRVLNDSLNKLEAYMIARSVYVRAKKAEEPVFAFLKEYWNLCLKYRMMITGCDHCYYPSLGIDKLKHRDELIDMLQELITDIEERWQ